AADPSRADHRTGGAAKVASGVPLPLPRHQRRADLLWTRRNRAVPAGSPLRRPLPQRRKTGRSAGASGYPIRADHQPQACQGARPRRCADAARARRRGDRVKRREFIALLGRAAAAWPLAVRAQLRERVRRISMINVIAETDPEASPRVAVFETALRKLGIAGLVFSE